MARLKTERITFKWHPEVIALLRKVVDASPPETLSGFAQDAVLRSLRSYRPPMEFVAETRERKGRSKMSPGAIDANLYRKDGWPLVLKDQMSEKDLKILYNASGGERMVREDLDAARESIGAPAMTEAEWLEVEKVLGPRRKPAANNDWGDAQ